MSTSHLKARHYTALSNSLRRLHSELSESEVLFDAMAGQLDAMQKLGIHTGSQFMAVSRLLDVELIAANEKAMAANAVEQQRRQENQVQEQT